MPKDESSTPEVTPEVTPELTRGSGLDPANQVAHQAAHAALSTHRLVPVIALQEVAHAAPLATALVAGGLPVAEVTFRTEAAAEAIRVMADLEVTNSSGEATRVFVGAGTVLSPDQADAALAAGARFAVSPGFNPRVVAHCQDIGLPIVPGVSNPTDIEMALEHGITTVKFFPAEAFGGLATLKAIAAPYGMMRFVPTGGIGPKNVADYLAFPKVLACGGSWMVNPSLYQGGDFTTVERLTREAVALVRDVKDR